MNTAQQETIKYKLRPSTTQTSISQCVVKQYIFNYVCINVFHDKADRAGWYNNMRRTVITDFCSYFTEPKAELIF